MTDDLTIPDDPFDGDYGPLEVPAPSLPPLPRPRLTDLLLHYRILAAPPGADQLPQQELAYLSGIDQSTISEIETGKRRPQDMTLRQLAKVFAEQIGSTTASEVFNFLKAARDNQPAPEKLPDEVNHIIDQLMAYPAPYRGIVVKALVAVADGFQTAYKRLSRFR